MRRYSIWFVPALLGFCVCATLATSSIASLLDDRQANMREIARSFGPMVQMYRRMTFDAPTVRARSTEIASALQRLSTLYPPGSEHADRWSSSDIWTDRAGFDKANAKAYAAAVALSKAGDQNTFRDGLQRLGGACIACHHGYRN